jgi:adhesin transport system membrane fusion protein
VSWIFNFLKGFFNLSDRLLHIVDSKLKKDNLLISSVRKFFNYLSKISLLGHLSLFLLFFVFWAYFFDIDQSIRTQGQIIAASRTQVIQATDGGVIRDIKVQEGQQIEEGDILVQLEQDKALTGYSAAVAELSSINNVLSSVKLELKMHEKLFVSGDIGELEVLRLKRQVSELVGKLSVAQEKLKDQKIALDRTELKSQTSGIVKLIKINTVGGFLKPGDEVMHIAPTNDGLVLEVKINPADIANMKVGLPAKVRLDAYDSSIYGSLTGEVTYISPDTLTESGPQGQQATYYRAHIKVSESELGNVKNKDIKLLLGLSAAADIRTGSRSVMTYLLKPINRSFTGALTEK